MKTNEKNIGSSNKKLKDEKRRQRFVTEQIRKNKRTWIHKRIRGSSSLKFSSSTLYPLFILLYEVRGEQPTRRSAKTDPIRPNPSGWVSF